MRIYGAQSLDSLTRNGFKVIRKIPRFSYAYLGEALRRLTRPLL